jgi:hypothetical protein
LLLTGLGLFPVPRCFTLGTLKSRLSRSGTLGGKSGLQESLLFFFCGEEVGEDPLRGISVLGGFPESAPNVRKHYQRERIIRVGVDRRNTDSSSRIEKRCPKVHSELVKKGLRN